MKKIKLLAWGGVLAVAICFSGCSSPDLIAPPTSVVQSDTNTIFHYYIYVSAEGSGSYMPFDGVACIWYVDAPAAEPPKRDPDDSVHWDASDPNPTLYGDIYPGGTYLLWQGYQLEEPPNSGWVKDTEVYCVYADGDENYNGSCVFDATK
jgi:hypothetical protein